MIRKVGGLKAHEDENAGSTTGCKFAGQKNKRGVYNVIDILDGMVLDEITWERVSRE